MVQARSAWRIPQEEEPAADRNKKPASQMEMVDFLELGEAVNDCFSRK